ncbi:MAG: Crp/Fnr family transcriptional regulator [Bacteroidota bacterium]
MYESIKKALYSINPNLTDEEWNFLKSSCSPASYSKKEFFIQKGEIQTSIGFVHSGLMRGYYIDEKGDDISVRFVRENGYATHYSALINRQPSTYFFQCLEDTEVILLPYQKVLEGYEQFKGLERFGRLIAEQVLTFQRSRIEDFQFLSAEERYKKFLDSRPALFNRISLSHLSTYLGIQRPSLSRIRKKLAEE